MKKIDLIFYSKFKDKKVTNCRLRLTRYSELIEELDGCLKEEAGIHGVVILHKTL